MDHYQRQLLIAAAPHAVYQALTTSEGLRGWWTQTCDVATAVGGRHTFHFNDTYKVMEIERLSTDQTVRWACVEAHLEAPGISKKSEWVGTHIVFKLSAAKGGNTVLDFEHIGLTPSLQCFEVCQNGWNQFLASLQSFAETGRGKPLMPSNLCQPDAAAARGDSNSAIGIHTPSSDSIKRSIHIKAPHGKVWRAISNAEAYGNWFGANLKGQTFAPGQRVKGPITIAGYEHVEFDVIIERIEPENLLSYRWHPYAIDAVNDYSKEERTLVTFTLQEAAGGTLLTVTETGFDKVAPERRLMAFRMNSAGWEGQLRNIDRYATSESTQHVAQAHA